MRGGGGGGGKSRAGRGRTDFVHPRASLRSAFCCARTSPRSFFVHVRAFFLPSPLPTSVPSHFLSFFVKAFACFTHTLVGAAGAAFAETDANAAALSTRSEARCEGPAEGGVRARAQ